MGPLAELMTFQLSVVGASASPSGATIGTERPNLPVSAASSPPARTPVSMLRGALFPFEVAAIGPSASHAPRRPSDDGTIAASPAMARRGPRPPNKKAGESHVPNPPAPKKISLRFQRLRQHARSIFEHHLYLLSINDSHDVSVTKLPVPNEVVEAEGLRCSIGLERRDELPEHGLLPTRLAQPFGFCRCSASRRRRASRPALSPP